MAVNGNSPQRPIKGTVWVDTPERPSGSPTYPLDIVAAVSADGKKLAISMVNPTESAQDCELALAGVQANGGARRWQLTRAGAPAAPPTPGRGFTFGPPATMEESSLPQAPRRVTLPPTSISVYELEIR